MPTIGVLLSGCGVYDGSEIHEAVFTLYELARHRFDVVCLAPDAQQAHVINHITGEPTEDSRNTLVESARIARGNITALDKSNLSTLDALVLPGGFGTAKNHTTWAFDGPASTIREDVRNAIQVFVAAGKPVVGLCMAPTTIAKALEGTNVQAHLTVGTPDEPSPYDIAAISAGIEQVGARAHFNSVREITVDASNHIISAPCYMMDATITEVRENVAMAMDALAAMLSAE
jgi:enhancing lycopene biosynthesis protein 2